MIVNFHDLLEGRLICFNDNNVEYKFSIDQAVNNEFSRYTIDCTATLLDDMQASDISCQISWFPISNTSALDRYNSFVEVDKRSNIPLTDLNPLLITGKTRDKYFTLSCIKNQHAGNISVSKDGVLVTTLFFDAPFLHPSWNYTTKPQTSTALKQQGKGTIYNTRFQLSINTTAMTVVKKSLYPGKNRCAFIITDHCDFDETERLELFLHGASQDEGWIGKGLKMTKGVFKYGARNEDIKKSESLECPEYLELIKELRNDGSEIAPHALKHSGQVTQDEFREGLAYLDSNFQCRSWIDHGKYLRYCYSQYGEQEYDLINILKQYNYNNLWNYNDVLINAVDSLNMFHNKPAILKKRWALFFKTVSRGKVKILLHHIRSYFFYNYKKSFFFDFVLFSFGRSKVFLQSPKKILSPKEVQAFFKSYSEFIRNFKNESLPYDMQSLANYGSPIFTLSHRPLCYIGDTELAMYSTIEIPHVKDMYTKGALDVLIKEGGLHIGHTYILNLISYQNNIFDNNNGKKLSREWIGFVGYLSSRVASQDVWNPTISECVDYLKRVNKVLLEQVAEDHFTITNESPVAINDFSFDLWTSAKSAKKFLLNGVEIKPVDILDKQLRFSFSIDAGAVCDFKVCVS
jgi:hypothetical protein